MERTLKPAIGALRFDWAASAALVLWLAALFGFGASLDDYSHFQHPIALLGAAGVEDAGRFNLLAFVVPGALVAWSAFMLRQSLGDARWALRIGAWLLLLSALAFAVQGLLPLDPEDLDAQSSRLHAVAWSLWWIAFAAGALLLMTGSRMRALGGVVLAAALLVAALLAPAALTQRFVVAAWFGFVILARASERTART